MVSGFSADVEEDKFRAILGYLDRAINQGRSFQTVEGVVSAPSREELEARLAQNGAETALQFEQLRGDIRELKAASVSKATLIITAIALFAAIISVLIGLSALGWQGFGIGMSAHDAAVSAAREALAAKR